MTSVKSLTNIKGKYVLVRTDFNEPVKNGKLLSDMRIRAALPTIMLLRKKGARVVLISHIGRDPKESMKPVYTVLKRHIPVRFVPQVLGQKVTEALGEMKNGDVILLENLRSNKGEKDGDPLFAKALSKFGDIYVNEAFPVSHRNDASIVALAKLLPAYAGLQLEREVKELSRALAPKRPFLFILGGAKAETKIPLLKRYLKEADAVFLGGELANDFFAAEGFGVGKSTTDKGLPSLVPYLKSEKLIVPEFVVVDRKGKKTTVMLGEVRKNEKIFDIAASSIEALLPDIRKAKLILWNGPMGFYEGGYIQGTERLLSLLAKARAETIIGGGDTSVLVERKKLARKFTFVSTGGGATLDFLAKGTLPGIKALH